MKVIKVKHNYYIWDGKIGKYISDNAKIGMIREVYGNVPDGYITYIPNRIFDRRKYPELYSVFGKDHMPTETEMNYYMLKNENNIEDNNIWKYICLFVVLCCVVITLIWRYLI